MYFFKKFIPENISSVHSHIISISCHQQQFFRTYQCCRVFSDLRDTHLLHVHLNPPDPVSPQDVPLQRRMLNLFISELVHI